MLSLAVIVAVVAWLITDTRWPGSLTGLGSREDWAVVQCDVGQGDALVLRTGPRRAMLVDTGPEPDAVDACLSRWRVDRLDLVVITHFHADHAGGLAGALPGRGRPPVLVSPCARPGAQVAGATEATAEAGTEMRTGGPGLAGRLGDGGWPVHWEIVWPVLPGVTGAAGAARSARAACGGVSSDHSEGSEINDASLELFAVVRGIRVVVLGDVEISAQRLLAGRLRALGAVDVVKVAHHGSAKQHPPLYASLRARVALIGVGDNDYGHPAPSALTMLAATGARVLRTDRQGDLAVIARPRGLGIWTDHSGRRRRHRRRSDGRGGRGGRDVVE